MAEDPAPNSPAPAKSSRTPLIAASAAIAAVLGGGLFFSTQKSAPPSASSAPAASTPAAPAQATASPAPAQPSADPTAPPAPPTPPTAGNVSIASAGGSAVNFADESLTFSVAMPNGPADDPVLAHVRSDAEGYLKSIKSNARADFNRIKKSGAKPSPWEVRIQWKYTAKSGDVVSLAGESNEYAGGAHPIEKFDTYTARANGTPLKFDDMLLPQKNPSPALLIGICEALKAEKVQRIKAATILDEPITCAGFNSNVKLEAAKIALAPSTTPGKFGGIFVYYDPYAVGAYAEGPYKLTVQQTVFAEDLKPEFKGMFAGMAPESPN